MFKLSKMTKQARNRLAFIISLKLTLLLGLLAILFRLFILTNSWINTHEIVFNKVLEVKLQRPITIKTRIIEIISPVINVLDYPDEIDTDIERYICDKFGIYQCQTALAVAQAESNLNCDAMGVNTNGTVDYGIFQLNSIHWERFGGLKNLVTCEKQVDSAYILWSEEGWNPWVTYWNNKYKENL